MLLLVGEELGQVVNKHELWLIEIALLADDSDDGTGHLWQLEAVDQQAVAWDHVKR